MQITDGLQVPILTHRPSTWLPRYQMYASLTDLWPGSALLTPNTAALERVPEIKPQDVQEVFFGNVLSAK